MPRKITFATREAHARIGLFTSLVLASGPSVKESLRLDKVKRTNLSDAVAERVISEIREGRYRAGDRIPTERELAEQLGVGRTSVREGLRFLEKTGVLEIRQGVGMVVRSLSLEKVFEHLIPVQTIIELPDRDVRNIMHVRRVLEAESARLAAENGNEQQLERLGKLLDDMAASLERPRDYLELDLEFHVVLAEAAGNPVLAQLTNLIRDIYTRYFEIVVEAPEMNKTSLQFHRKVYAALRERDPDAAHQHIIAHLLQAEKDVLKLLDSKAKEATSPRTRRSHLHAPRTHLPQ
jgi:GntR family transcriptional repressor for pyruvate dehydrogenase complex